MPAILLKTRAVLDRIDPVSSHEHVEFAYVAYVSEVDDGEAPSHIVQMTYDVWRDMGEPDTITVTIEPGDLLNGEGA